MMKSIYVRDGNVWTSAGVTAGIDLALAMIEADLGRATALAVARLYVVFRIRPGGQRQYSTELAAQAIRDDRLSRLAERIAQRPEHDWRTPTLAIEAGMSVRSLSRLFRKELNVSPAEFVERVRIDRARRDLLDTNAPIKRVASGAGSEPIVAWIAHLPEQFPQHQPNSAPVNLTTFSHLVVSCAMCSAKSAGEPTRTVPPRSAKRALKPGSARTVLIALFSVLITSTGVLLGAPAPNHRLAS